LVEASYRKIGLYEVALQVFEQFVDGVKQKRLPKQVLTDILTFLKSTALKTETK
jgi:hypothetical protein